MNVFIIPSWYHSKDSPNSGNFTKEQVEALARLYPTDNFAISLWGQKDENLLLWAKDHIYNLTKLVRFTRQASQQVYLADNLLTYYRPALTWSMRVLKGNIQGIIASNESNFRQFTQRFGPPDIIHAHAAYPAGYIAWKIALKYQTPFVITEHMSPFPFECYRKNGGIIPQVLDPLREADAIISVSPQAAADIRQKTGVEPLVIPNLVNERLFHPQPIPAPGPSRPFTFFSMGRMVAQKGIPDLLQAISMLSTTTAVFRIGGEGEELGQYKQLADRLQISSRISWLGALSRTEAAAEFKNCHAFVLPSIHESMGVVFAEAIACGKPIVATRCGGAESIVNPINGLLCPVGAPRQLAEAMDQIIQHYHSYSSAEIREDFMKRFSSAVVSRQIYSLYQKLYLGTSIP